MRRNQKHEAWRDHVNKMDDNWLAKSQKMENQTFSGLRTLVRKLDIKNRHTG